MYYLGVDGGGTKTAFALISQKGEVLGLTTIGTAHPDQVGLEGSRRALEQGLSLLCAQAGIEKEEIKASVWGLAGFGENLAHQSALETMVGEILQSSNYYTVNDVEVGWAGSLACQAGLHLVAGTGAIGFGRDVRGQAARSSGWSEIFGDEGSAYWLGRRLLQLFSKQADHRLPRTLLYDLVRRHFSLKRDLDLIPLISENSQRGFIAQIAKIAFQAALAGDEQALGLYQKAAYEQSLIFHSLLKQLHFPQAELIPASYSGGVFEAGDLILKPLGAYVEPWGIRLQEPELTPVLGAALYALEKSGAPWDTNTVSTLKGSLREKS